MRIKPGDIVRFPIFVSLDDQPVAQLSGFGQVLEIEGDKVLIQAVDKITWEDISDVFLILSESEYFQKKNEWLKGRPQNIPKIKAP